MHLPAVVVSAPIEDGGQDEDGPAFSVPLDQRCKIFGENVLPDRPSKNLWQLMWAAMKDKVLVCLFYI
jgi:Ca2+-transporting ATPase